MVEYPVQATAPPNLRRARRRDQAVGAGAWGAAAEVEVGADGEASGRGGVGTIEEEDDEEDDEEGHDGGPGVTVNHDGSISWKAGLGTYPHRSNLMN